MTPASISNTIIRASAGSGKTFALVQRLVRLLALDVKPDSIVALTFTRKAAGEFFARLLQKLAHFVEHPEEASSYTPELAKDTKTKCLRLLRLLLAQMDRMRLGTLDSFFAAMVQSLPFELGLTGVGALMSPEEERQAHEEVLDAVLVDLMRPENEGARKELIEAWKLATLGSESNRPADDIRNWMEHLHDWYLECADAEPWGHSKRIWPDATSSIWKADADLKAVRAKLEDVIVIEAFKDKRAHPKWREFYEDLERHVPGMPLTETLGYMLDPKRGSASLLAEGRGVWKMGTGKEVTLTPEASILLHQALHIVVGRELHTACTRTQGRSRLVGLYEKEYQRLVRGAGRLCFSDLALLLSGRLDPGGSSDWQERWPQVRTDMEYRLDARYDHWLFDEFQDTSRRQWRVFENLVDEVLQDAEARRTFFAVGDLKQSIYLWREAEPELFLGVERKYAEHRMAFESLKVSWRSCPQVLQMVNDTFANENALKEQLPGAMEWWRFDPHASAPKLANVCGHSAFLTVAQRTEKEDALVALLRHLQPLARGLTCAVLVRKNDAARSLAVRLRADLDCEVVCESEQDVVVDNPVTLALLSILQLAAHPSDTQAWHHVCMTPLGAWLDSHGTKAGALGADVRHQLRTGGFLGASETWIKILREACSGALDSFSEWRVRQFLEVAASFDGTGSRDVDAFLRFARDHRAAGPGDKRALQVMTVHKSKGLEFDIVILPDLQVTILDDARRQRLLWQRDDDGEIAWLLDKPPAPIVEWDGRLTPEVERLEARAAFEGLCRLYVAMTRAKRGLYLLHHNSGITARRSEAGLVRDVLKGQGSESEYPVPHSPPLQCLYEQGQREWFESSPLKPAHVATRDLPPSVAPDRKPLAALLRASGEVISRRTPSGEEQHLVLGRDLFSARRQSSREMGLVVHGLFSEVPWLDAKPAPDLETIWKNSRWSSMPGFDEARLPVLRCLAQPDIRAWFELRGTSRTAWLERTVDFLDKREWVSGQMDRVVVDLDAQGRPTSATILDFKTDDVTDSTIADRAKGYLPQLSLYIAAVRRLTALPAEKIRTALIFTSLGKLHWVS